MRCFVLKILEGRDMHGKYFQKFKTLIDSARYGEYVTLCNIMILLHPTIMGDTLDLHITNQGIATPFIVSVNNVIVFIDIGPTRAPFI